MSAYDVRNLPHHAPFYASGSRGKTMRANREGGFMARGWYYRDADDVSQGPFASEAVARRKRY